MMGVMVVHNGVEMSSQDHRLFTIRSTDTANDTKALSEVLGRRLKHDEWPYPTMIVVDGGTAQKRVMEKVLREHNLSIPVVSVVKDERHKAKAILGQKKLIEQHKETILAINAESHRFALSAHKKKRRRGFLEE
jgi:excinuclease ABC subunit C